MWKDLNEHWQEAVIMALDAYKNNTIPIGAIVVNQKGEIVSRGKNRIFDTDSNHPMAGTYMAHAEMTAMLELKEDDHPNIRTYKLYTTMEPCPMCFGTMMMMHIKYLHFGAWDKFAGALELKEKTAYLRGKTFEMNQGPMCLQQFQISMQTAFEYIRKHKYRDALMDKWAIDYPKSVAVGKRLYEEQYLEKALAANEPMEKIYDGVIQYHEEMND